MKNPVTEWKNTLALLFIGAGLSLIVPLFFLYSLGAVNDPGALTKFFLYSIISIFSIYVINEIGEEAFEGNFDEDRYYGFRIFGIHNPQETFLGKTFPKVMNWKSLLILSFIVFNVFGMLVGVSGQFVAGSPDFIQGSVQGGTTSQLGLAVEPAVSSETLLFNVVLLFSQMAGLIYVFVDKFGVKLGTSIIFAKIISVLATSVEFLVYHEARYGNVESSQFSIFMLGLMTNSLTALTNSFIPAYFLHGSGNFYDKLASMGLFTNELAITVGLILTVLSIVFAWFYFDPFGDDSQ